ncbi:ogr/Delta-like zinc finger family protein [Sphingomonas oryzagri]|uniref:Ogr/Delta-like zinc finger family protein n=1 Tax=Sphingomonas oryzagri TaxID=3042314 RepID=A0ABT6N7T5_9SPHN|nr:ogr/Delta-like zinc finger family protein [Sphingomonas oryzagri]MDH7641169.1 ogr/Delta-like zinc finger family protein [Sphingomonas oryzagri]
MKRDVAFPCPHCGGRTLIRSSEQVSDTVRETRMRCDNDDCGFSFVAQISVIRTIQPSLQPKPGVVVPLGNQNLRWDRRRPPDLLESLMTSSG